MEPSAVAARRTRASLALAVGGALSLMTGVALALIGAALRLDHPVRPLPLVALGLILAVLGLALGASAMVATLLDAPTGTLSAPAPAPWTADPPGAAQAAAEPAHAGETVPGEVLSSFMLPDQPPAAPVPCPEVVPGAPLRPPGRHRAAPVPSAREPMASEVMASEVMASEPLASEPLGGEPIMRRMLARELMLGEPVVRKTQAREPMASEPAAREVLASEVLAGYADTGWSIEADDWASPAAEPPEGRQPVRR